MNAPVVAQGSTSCGVMAHNSSLVALWVALGYNDCSNTASPTAHGFKENDRCI